MDRRLLPVRRPELALALPAAAAVALLAQVASAQGVDEFGAFGGAGRQKRESKQSGAVEIRVGRYLPNVDDEFGGRATPFQDVFGNDNRYLVGVEVDWQALRIPHFGTFGPGLGFGYTKISGKGFAESGARTGETSLSFIPAYVVGVLRADVLARETPVPLVPYAKLGVGVAPWWTSDGGGASRANGVVGRGLSYGYQFALGGMFLLDFLDRDSAVEMDVNTGVNNSYFFTEWYFSDLSGFGSGKLQLGTSTWMLGLAFEF